MNSRLDKLQEYPFQRLNRLLDGQQAPAGKQKIMLSLGEPKHEPPAFIHDILANGGHLLAGYPGTRGEEDLRGSICNWLSRRFSIKQEQLDPARHVLPVSGSRVIVSLEFLVFGVGVDPLNVEGQNLGGSDASALLDGNGDPIFVRWYSGAVVGE